MTASITLLRAPHATFYSKGALEEFASNAIATERAIMQFRADGCDIGLFEDLRALGWPDSEIELVVANPFAPFDCLYGVAAD